MGSRTRYFFIGAALVVVVGLGTGLVAYYGGLWAQPGRPDLDYIARDSTAVGFANVREIVDSPFHQRLRQSVPAGQARSEFQSATGIDIERDVDSVVVGLRGTGPNDGRAVALVRGRFDREKIEGLATQHGARVEDYKAVRILLKPGEDPGNSAGFAFLEPGLIAFGQVAGLKSAVDTAASGEAVTDDSDIMRAVTGMQTSGNAWLVARPKDLSGNAEMPEALRQHLAGLQWLAVGADVDQNVRGRVRAEARDAQAAEDLRAVIGGMLGAARMFAARDARFQAALESIQTSGTGPVIEVSFAVPADIIDLIGAMPHAVPDSTR